MPDELTFQMGKFPAVLPLDRRYCRNHMWCQPFEDRYRFGFTSYAVRLMQDVYFLEWSVDEGTALAASQKIGYLETSKATSELFAPVPGNLLAFNQELLADPSGINVSNYGDGWLFEMQGDLSATMTAQEYHDFLDKNWEKTQNMVKGHL